MFVFVLLYLYSILVPRVGAWTLTLRWPRAGLGTTKL